MFSLLPSISLRRTFVLLFCLLFSMLGVVSCNGFLKQSSLLVTANQFSQIHIGDAYALFDLGVADINDDGWLDIFSTNHNARQLFEINQSGENFVDKAAEMGFLQNYEALEGNVPTVQTGNNPGLHVFWDNYVLKVQVAKPEQISRFDEFGLSGTVIVPETAEVRDASNFEIDEKNNDTIGKIVRFKSNGAASLEIKFPASEPFFRPKLLVGRWLDLNQIYLGAEASQPASHEFVLPPINALPHMDRHGIAWSDIDDNGLSDALIIRGGMNGQIAELAPNAKDELFVQTISGFEDNSNNLELDKQGCAARKVSWLDLNQDNALDVYIACGRHLPLGALQAHRLYEQVSIGKFVDVSETVNLDLAGVEGESIWIDVDNDNDLDLFQGDEVAIRVWKNESGIFLPSVLQEDYQSKIDSLTAGDYDNDGFIDVFADTRQGARLFKNNGGQFEVVQPETIGLPERAKSVRWVDYDNDSLLDLYSVPRGLYRQTSDHQFEKIDLLQQSPGETIKGYPFTTWFDANNDGAMDLLMSNRVDITRWEKFRNRFKAFQDVFQVSRANKDAVLLYKNTAPTSNHWLQVRLDGGEGNHPAIGAVVKLETPDGTVQTRAVGQFDGSYRSQGHYRLYFGLGENDAIKRLLVIWPDGTEQEETATIDQVISVEKA